MKEIWRPLIQSLICVPIIMSHCPKSAFSGGFKLPVAMHMPTWAQSVQNEGGSPSPFDSLIVFSLDSLPESLG